MHSLEGTFGALEQSSDIPSIDSLIYLLQDCRKAKTATGSKRAHALLNKYGLEAHNALGNRMVPVLVDCGCFESAFQTFSKLSHHNEHSWTSLIQGISECKMGWRQPLNLLKGMQEEDAEATSYTFLALLKICMQGATFEDGQQIHEEIAKEGFEEDPHVASVLMSLYAKFGTLLEAQDVFDQIEVRDMVLWTSMIMIYVEHGFVEEALLCSKVVEKDGVAMDITFCVCILQACGTARALDMGHEIHAVTIKRGFEGDLFVGNSLVDMYSKCNCLKEALEVFDKLPLRDVVSWNSLIDAYSENGTAEDVFTCLERMRIEGVIFNSITLVSAFGAFGAKKEKGLLETMHSEIVKMGIPLDLFVGNALLESYSKCGLLAEAQNVFDNLSVVDLVSWTSLLGGYSEQGLFEEAFSCFEQMQVDGILLDAVALVCLLNLCCRAGALDIGSRLHTLAIVDGFDSDLAVSNSLIDLYANCNKMIEAEDTFNGMMLHSVVSWNALLAGYAEHGFGDETLDCLERMRSKRVSPNLVTYVCGLQGCGNIGIVHIGQSLHKELTEKGYDHDLLVGNTLLDTYSKCGSFVEALHVFEGLQDRNVVSWVALLSGYVEKDYCADALDLFQQMKADGVMPNALAYINILRACGKLRALDEAQSMYLDIVLDDFDTDQLIVNALVNLYAKCGSLSEAHELFHTSLSRDTTSWNALLTGLLESGLNAEVLEGFAQMDYEGVSADSVTFVCCLKACGHIGSLNHGQLLHLEAVKDGLEANVSVCQALIDMYSKLGFIQEVEDVFEELLTKTDNTWSALLTGYDDMGLFDKVLSCFESMLHFGYPAKAWMYGCCLRACMNTGSMVKGRQLHVGVIIDGKEQDAMVACSLVDMYARCGFFHEAYDILHEQPVNDTAHWNALLLGYLKHGCSENVMEILESMSCKNVCPDAVTYMCSLKACISLGAIDKGKELHAMILREEYDLESQIGNTLIDMYAKFGLLSEAQDVFNDLLVHDVVSWSALITGYACQGDFQQVSNLFEKLTLHGMQPDEVLLLRLLSACSHAGLVERGQVYFENIFTQYNTMITVEHVNCMMDLLSRAGQLDELIAMAERIPCVPDIVTLTTLLGACQKWGILELGQQAFNGAKNVDGNEASFVLLSNMHAGNSMVVLSGIEDLSFLSALSETSCAQFE